MKLQNEIQYEEGKVARKVVIKNENGMVVLLAFDKGTKLDTHMAEADVLVQVIEGAVDFTVNDIVNRLEAGESITLEPAVLHSVAAADRAKVLVTRINVPVA